MPKLRKTFHYEFTSRGKNDEWETPEYVVQAIVPYIGKHSVVWCPFDRHDSPYVRVLEREGLRVVHSHIDYGQDYYHYEPRYWDIMVSNPPFTNKREIFSRALFFGKPFALLMSNTWLNDSAPKDLFKHRDLQLLMFRNRVKFLKDGKIVDNRITFSSSYFCCNLLPKQIIINDQ